MRVGVKRPVRDDPNYSLKSPPHYRRKHYETSFESLGQFILDAKGAAASTDTEGAQHGRASDPPSKNVSDVLAAFDESMYAALCRYRNVSTTSEGAKLGLCSLEDCCSSSPQFHSGPTDPSRLAAFAEYSRSLNEASAALKECATGFLISESRTISKNFAQAHAVFDLYAIMWASPLVSCEGAAEISHTLDEVRCLLGAWHLRHYAPVSQRRCVDAVIEGLELFGGQPASGNKMPRHLFVELSNHITRLTALLAFEELQVILSARAEELSVLGTALLYTINDLGPAALRCRLLSPNSHRSTLSTLRKTMLRVRKTYSDGSSSIWDGAVNLLTADEVAVDQLLHEAFPGMWAACFVWGLFWRVPSKDTFERLNDVLPASMDELGDLIACLFVNWQDCCPNFQKRALATSHQEYALTASILSNDTAAAVQQLRRLASEPGYRHMVPYLVDLILTDHSLPLSSLCLAIDTLFDQAEKVAGRFWHSTFAARALEETMLYTEAASSAFSADHVTTAAGSYGLPDTFFHPESEADLRKEVEVWLETVHQGSERVVSDGCKACQVPLGVALRRLYRFGLTREVLLSICDETSADAAIELVALISAVLSHSRLSQVLLVLDKIRCALQEAVERCLKHLGASKSEQSNQTNQPNQCGPTEVSANPAKRDVCVLANAIVLAGLHHRQILHIQTLKTAEAEGAMHLRDVLDEDCFVTAWSSILDREWAQSSGARQRTDDESRFFELLQPGKPPSSATRRSGASNSSPSRGYENFEMALKKATALLAKHNLSWLLVPRKGVHWARQEVSSFRASDANTVSDANNASESNDRLSAQPD